MVICVVVQAALVSVNSALYPRIRIFVDVGKVEAIRPQLVGRDACLGILLSSVATSKTHGERPCFYSADESGHLRPDNFVHSQNLPDYLAKRCQQEITNY